MNKITTLFLVVFLLSSCVAIKRKNIEAAQYNARIGLIYLHKNNFTFAKAKLLLALQQAPNDPAVLGSFAYFLEKTGNVKLANKYYLMMLKAAPNGGVVQNNYGAYLCRRGFYKQGIRYFLAAANNVYYLHTSNAYGNAARCALKIPDKILAKKYLNRAKQNQGE